MWGNEREKEYVCEEEMGEKERAAAAIFAAAAVAFVAAAVATFAAAKGRERSFVELG